MDSITDTLAGSFGVSPDPARVRGLRRIGITLVGASLAGFVVFPVLAFTYRLPALLLVNGKVALSIPALWFREQDMRAFADRLNVPIRGDFTKRVQGSLDIEV